MNTHKRNCASLTQMLLSDPPKPAPCDCGAESPSDPIRTDSPWSARIDYYDGEGNLKFIRTEESKLALRSDTSSCVEFRNDPLMWARIDKDNVVTHLDMDVCARGPVNLHSAIAIAVWNAAIDAAAEFVGQNQVSAQEYQYKLMELKK